MTDLDDKVNGYLVDLLPPKLDSDDWLLFLLKPKGPSLREKLAKAWDEKQYQSIRDIVLDRLSLDINVPPTTTKVKAGIWLLGWSKSEIDTQFCHLFLSAMERAWNVQYIGDVATVLLNCIKNSLPDPKRNDSPSSTSGLIAQGIHESWVVMKAHGVLDAYQLGISTESDSTNPDVDSKIKESSFLLNVECEALLMTLKAFLDSSLLVILSFDEMHVLQETITLNFIPIFSLFLSTAGHHLYEFIPNLIMDPLARMAKKGSVIPPFSELGFDHFVKCTNLVGSQGAMETKDMLTHILSTAHIEVAGWDQSLGWNIIAVGSSAQLPRPAAAD
ncbi:hypothetical protein HD554DRAFT_2038072 [Boletus coccyginus]|nr:hypothetical protein HD554DRAFT_2038072 [Boletus coccyginus]